jgi:hypothetical protein
VQQAVDAPMLTEEERAAQAKKSAALATAKKAKRERQRRARAERALLDEASNEAQAKADGERARSAFDELLDELKIAEDESHRAAELK